MIAASRLGRTASRLLPARVICPAAQSLPHPRTQICRDTNIYLRRRRLSAGNTAIRTIVAASQLVVMSANGASNKSDALAALREEMRKSNGGKGVDAYIIPTEDPHMSEYSTASDERRHFISGFTGSAGTAVVTQSKALLWTDGRYFLQAEKQLGSEWTLMRGGTPSCPEIPDWLAENLKEGDKVGIDPFLHTVSAAKDLQKVLEEADMELLPLLGGNLVDTVWGSARPAPPKEPLRIHKIDWAGDSPAKKMAELRATMQKAKAGALVVTALDEIAWLFNLRGNDISYNPVFVAYALLTADSASLYVDKSKVSSEIEAHLKEAGADLKPYEDVMNDVRTLAAAGTKLWLDPAKVSFGLFQIATEGAQQGPKGKGRKRTRSGAQSPGAADGGKVSFVKKPSPISAAKAIKNKAELAGMEEAHLRDGVALATTFHHIESEIQAGRQLSEVDVDQYITGQRRAQGGFFEPSFPTIAGAGPNGAIIHYRAEPATAGTIGSNTLLLLDSGGQYDCGTTDVTRTFHLGEPNAYQKTCFTRVLQGHIKLDQAIFPEGTPGLALDSFARTALWSQGLNYRHGTGHGVGAALNVHEGPQSISPRTHVTYPLQAGMVVSNEPGYYEDGSFGIRIENLLVIEEAATQYRFGGQSYLCFKRLTFSPIQRKMLALEILSPSEIQWINEYHKEVLQKVGPRIQNPAVLTWLKKNTEPIKVPAMVAA